MPKLLIFAIERNDLSFDFERVSTKKQIEVNDAAVNTLLIKIKGTFLDIIQLTVVFGFAEHREKKTKNCIWLSTEVNFGKANW